MLLNRTRQTDWPAQYLQYTLHKSDQESPKSGRLAPCQNARHTPPQETALYGKLAEGKRSQGGQKKRYKDFLKASLKGFDINTETWETQALDRLSITVVLNRLVEVHRPVAGFHWRGFGDIRCLE